MLAVRLVLLPVLPGKSVSNLTAGLIKGLSFDSPFFCFDTGV